MNKNSNFNNRSTDGARPVSAINARPVSAMWAILVFLCLSLSAFAQTGTPNYTWYGDGTASSFSIANADQLAGLANLVNGSDLANSSQSAAVDFNGKTITLTANLDLATHYGQGVTGFNSGKGWIPIGNSVMLINKCRI